MKITRWTPAPSVGDLVGVQDEVNRLFDGFFTRSALRSDLAPAFVPAVDIQETPEEFIFHVDLPGVAQKDVKVSLMGDTLTIRGERKADVTTQGNGKSLHRTERIHGTFERSFSLGTPLRNDKVQAQYKDGVLEVRVPKAEEARMREIEVQVG
ncbi:MAG: Hsp20/alpha crystallin family protein [Candidatus Eisenbacteria bacterium]|nr:Hsp20/alpha crystallin family protein [Candidatus Eisenbacteria bacterium]